MTWGLSMTANPKGKSIKKNISCHEGFERERRRMRKGEEREKVLELLRLS